MRCIALLCTLASAGFFSVWAVPLKTTTTATLYERPDRAAKLAMDQEVGWKIDSSWGLSAGAEYAAAADTTFFSVPEKAGGRIGAVAVLPAGMYLDAFAGIASWFAEGTPSVTSAVIEGAWNAEGAVWYLGVRDRLLFNADSLVSVSTIRGKWHPNSFFAADARLLIAAESGLGVSPGFLAELTAAPFPFMLPFFFGLGFGGSRYARNYAEGGGYGTEGSLSAILGAKEEARYSARVTATRRLGGRGGDRWEIEAVVSAQL